MIRDRNTSMMYVRLASGKMGFLGRWDNYASNSTGGDDEIGNKKLVNLLNGTEV